MPLGERAYGRAGHVRPAVCVLLRSPSHPAWLPAACVQSIAEPAARAAYLWVLGEYGFRIQVGPAANKCRLGDCQCQTVLGCRLV